MHSSYGRSVNNARRHKSEEETQIRVMAQLQETQQITIFFFLRFVSLHNLISKVYYIFLTSITYFSASTRVRFCLAFESHTIEIGSLLRGAVALRGVFYPTVNRWIWLQRSSVVLFNIKRFSLSFFSSPRGTWSVFQSNPMREIKCVLHTALRSCLFSLINFSTTSREPTNPTSFRVFFFSFSRN